VKPLHVCLVTGEYPPAVGGIADYALLLARHLREEGLQVSVLTSGTAKNTENDVTTVPGWTLRFLAEIGARIAELRPDVVHLQYQTAAFGMSAAVSLLPYIAHATRGRPRFITTFHDLRVPYLFPRAGALRRAPARVLIGASDGCIYTDPADLRAAQPRGRAAWVPIGPGVVPSGRPNRATERERLHIDAGAFVIAYFGFMNSSKGVETLLAAAEHLLRMRRDFRLLYVGADQGISDPTNALTAARLRSLESQFGLETHIVRTGWLPDREISRALAAADVAALPYADGASLRRSALLTCFAHGLPVVTTEAAPGPELSNEHLVEPFDQPERYRIGESVAALVQPGHALALADQFVHLADDSDRRQALGRAGKALARRLSWPRVARATAGFYNSILRAAA
jgi:polysaccharide biosynthesis protein PslF